MLETQLCRIAKSRFPGCLETHLEKYHDRFSWLSHLAVSVKDVQMHWLEHDNACDEIISEALLYGKSRQNWAEVIIQGCESSCLQLISSFVKISFAKFQLFLLFSAYICHFYPLTLVFLLFHLWPLTQMMMMMVMMMMMMMVTLVQLWTTQIIANVG